MPVAITRREPSKLPRPSTANISLPRPSWNQPKINANKEEQCKTRQNLRPRPSTSHVTSGARACKASLHLVPAKSRYCLTEDSRNRTATRPSPKEERSEPRAAVSGQGCDVTFLKKLLAMNKKQEMAINMKLVELMKERESNVSRDDRWCDSKRPVEKLLASSSVVETQSSGRSERWHQVYERRQTSHQRELEYDLNGRRVYHFSDDENDQGNAETWIENTTTVIETTSDGGEAAREVSSKRQSLTVIKQPVRSAEEGRGRKGEKVVVHCVEPEEDSKERLKNRHLKVWNYKSLLNTGDGGEGDGELKNTTDDYTHGF